MISPSQFPPYPCSLWEEHRKLKRTRKCIVEILEQTEGDDGRGSGVIFSFSPSWMLVAGSESRDKQTIRCLPLSITRRVRKGAWAGLAI